MTSPVIEEMRAQRRARPIIAGPDKPVITNRIDQWRKRQAYHEATGQHYPLRLWRA